MRPAIIVVDNYDSFTQNVVHALVSAGATCDVVAHDAATAAALVARRAHGYVISAGPCTPTQSGASATLSTELAKHLPHVPLLGLCLGHQAIALALGARLRRATTPMHGKLATIVHDESGILEVMPSPFQAARYNSLVVDTSTLPNEIIATGHDEDGDLMALRHAVLPHTGLQFHPESWLCPHAEVLLAAWVETTWVAGLSAVRHGLP